MKGNLSGVLSSKPKDDDLLVSDGLNSRNFSLWPIIIDLVEKSNVIKFITEKFNS